MQRRGLMVSLRSRDLATPQGGGCSRTPRACRPGVGALFLQRIEDGAVRSEAFAAGRDGCLQHQGNVLELGDVSPRCPRARVSTSQYDSAGSSAKANRAWISLRLKRRSPEACTWCSRWADSGRSTSFGRLVLRVLITPESTEI